MKPARLSVHNSPSRRADLGDCKSTSHRHKGHDGQVEEEGWRTTVKRRWCLAHLQGIGLRIAEAMECYQAALQLAPGDPRLRAKLQALGAPANLKSPAN
jgi:hypothetical protein